jgi:mono/diheme cytochrome c family protein
VSGCSNEYPADLRYPLRDDPLLVGALTLVPRHWDRPGDFPRGILETLPPDERATEAKRFASPADIPADARHKLDDALEDTFGTPQRPRMKGVADEARVVLRLDDKALAQGSALYRLHCLHCHGLTGNGRGPTAPWVNPHPRDYRQGIFKFTSTVGGNERKPRREDLLRTVRQGVEGTSMPSFGLLPEDDQEALVSYVIHLSLRGNVEFNVMQGLLGGSIEPGDVKSAVPDTLEGLVAFWTTSADEKHLIKPDARFPLPSGDERRQSVERGWALFRDPGAAGCIGCHKDYGRQGLLFFDSWGTIGRPTDLTTGVYRGGRRRIDLYWRMFNGVNGSNMPAFGPLLASEEYKAKERRDGIWDLVNFLEVLPYKAMREQYGVRID